MMFSGLMSRCTMPRSCASDTLAATCAQILAARMKPSGPSLLMSEPRSRPGRYSITRYTSRALSPKSKICTVLACVSLEMALASARKRRTVAASRASSPESSFMAIILPMWLCSTL